MPRFWLLLISMTVLILPTHGQEDPEGLRTEVDSTDMDIEPEKTAYEYWRPRYYDSIPEGKALTPMQHLDYEEMVQRYQTQDFDYVESISDKLSFFDRVMQRISDFLESLFPKPKMQISKAFYYIFAIAGGIILLVLLYRLFFSGKKIYSNDKDLEGDTAAEQLAYVERNLMKLDLMPYIDEAVRKEDYGMAIRYQLLRNIQLLQEKGLITWKQSKTNVELVADVKDVTLRKEFLDCAAIFDYVWFGDFKIDQASYNRYADQFVGFQRRWS